MKTYPILFSGPMVRAILAGKKTQTRREARPQPAGGVRASVFTPSGLEDIHGRPIRLPYSEGNRLWVRETVGLGERPVDGSQRTCVYRADFLDGPAAAGVQRWTPAIHMPRWASRLTLEITEVRLQRLQVISDADMAAEGIDCMVYADGAAATHYNRQAFAALWDKLNGQRAGCGWQDNPWVWAISFQRI